MIYCPHCRQLNETERCPQCHKWDGRPPEEDDLCLFAELDSVWSPILDDLLHQAEVPFVRQVTSGASTLLGSTMTRWRFYAPYGKLAAAREVREELSVPPEE